MSVTTVGLLVLLWAYLVVLALGLGSLVAALGWLLGWALAAVLAPRRARAVPLPACATHKRHGLLSRRIAGRTAMPTPGQVSGSGHHPPPVETTLPGPTTPPPSAHPRPWAWCGTCLVELELTPDANPIAELGRHRRDQHADEVAR